MNVAQDDGLYEVHWAAAIPTTTRFREWFAEMLRSVANA
jgi:hypothetical protein